MNDLVIVGALHTCADLLKHPKARLGIQLMFIAVHIDGMSLDVFHDEVG